MCSCTHVVIGCWGLLCLSEVFSVRRAYHYSVLVDEIDSGIVVSGGWFEGVMVEDDISRRLALVAQAEDW